jgi:pimeloyl-ACP methyl ester carboxylesterase
VIAGARLHQVVNGDEGPTIVATHGMGDDLHCYDEQATPMAQAGYRFVRWDLRGHGESEVLPPDGYGEAEAAGDVAAMVSAHPRPVVLVGHSFGGYLALSHALRYPDDVSALVLIATGPGYRNPESRRQWNEYVDQLAGSLQLPEGTEKLYYQHDSFVIDHLAELCCPVLQLLGEGEKRFRDGVSYIDRTVPHCQTVVIDGARHHPQRSHPEPVNRAITEFLAGETAPLSEGWA